MEENKLQPLSIPVPPDWVFKYRKNRLAPAQEVMQQQQAMFIWERMEYPETGGQLAWFNGVPYPAKGHPFPEAIYAVNFVKRMTRNSIIGLIQKDLWKEYIGFFLSFPKHRIKKIERFLTMYTDIANRVISPYILEDQYLSPCSREILKFTKLFLMKIGVNSEIAQNFAEVFTAQIEYDNAYRLRIEDAMSETTKEKIIENPGKELVRLGQIIMSREPNKGTGESFPKILGGIAKILQFPWYKKIFNECVKESNFENFQLDEGDRYHVLLWADYNFLGKSLDERIKIYSEIHKDGFPQRIIYKPQ
jgi:hypothetical protein